MSTRTGHTRTKPYKDQDKDKDKDLTHKDQDKDKDLNLVLKESIRTRTRINITGGYTQDRHAYTTSALFTFIKSLCDLCRTACELGASVTLATWTVSAMMRETGVPIPIKKCE